MGAVWTNFTISMPLDSPRTQYSKSMPTTALAPGAWAASLSSAKAVSPGGAQGFLLGGGAAASVNICEFALWLQNANGIGFRVISGPIRNPRNPRNPETCLT